MSRFQNLKGIDFLETPGNSGLNLVIFHGYGADANDLFPLSQIFSKVTSGRQVYPQGILEAPGTMGGRAWFPIDTQALERAMMTGEFRDFSQPVSSEFLDTQKKLTDFLESLNLDPENTVLGGFSQGAMMATDLFLHSNKKYKGLIIFSGTFIDPKRWNPKFEKLKDIPVFQSHGKNDPILPFNRAEALYSEIKRHGAQITFKRFKGGHEIPPEVLGDVLGYIHSLVQSVES